MVIFYIGAGIGLVLAVIYLIVGALSFLRIRRELVNGNGFDVLQEERVRSLRSRARSRVHLEGDTGRPDVVRPVDHRVLQRRVLVRARA